MTLDPQFAQSIRKVEVNFGFALFDCDPEEITKALGVVPHEIRRKGEQRQLRDGSMLTVPFSTWYISSSVESKDVNDHCRELLRQLAGAADRLDPRWGTPTFGVTYKATHLFSGNGPFFEVDVVQGIAALGAELWQDIYALEDDTTEREADPP